MGDETRTQLAGMTPLGRLGRPVDVAAVVEFLVSGEGRWISGQLLKSDGAFSARY